MFVDSLLIRQPSDEFPPIIVIEGVEDLSSFTHIAKWLFLQLKHISIKKTGCNEVIDSNWQDINTLLNYPFVTSLQQ